MDERSVGGRRAGRVGEVAPRMTRPSPQLARIAELAKSETVAKPSAATDTHVDRRIDRIEALLGL